MSQTPHRGYVVISLGRTLEMAAFSSLTEAYPQGTKAPLLIACETQETLSHQDEVRLVRDFVLRRNPSSIVIEDDGAAARRCRGAFYGTVYQDCITLVKLTAPKREHASLVLYDMERTGKASFCVRNGTDTCVIKQQDDHCRDVEPPFVSELLLILIEYIYPYYDVSAAKLKLQYAVECQVHKEKYLL